MANSGGVIVSYYEWLQNKRSEYWQEKIVLERLTELMKETFNRVYTKHKKEHITMRNSCYILAISKISETIKRKKLF